MSIDRHAFLVGINGIKGKTAQTFTGGDPAAFGRAAQFNRYVQGA